MVIKFCVIFISDIQHEIVADKDWNNYRFLIQDDSYEEDRLHFKL